MGRNAESTKSNKIMATYISEDYLGQFNKMLENLEMNRYEFLKGIVLAELVMRGYLSPLEIRKKDKELVEPFLEE